MLRETGRRKCSLEFDTPGVLSNQDYYRIAGITKAQFDKVLSYLVSIKPSEVRSVRTALAIHLVKLRTALSSSILSTPFGIRKRTLNNIIAAVRVDLCKLVVPQFLGFDHISS